MTTQDFNLRLTGSKDALIGYAFKLTQNAEDAQDLLQDTFVKAISYKNKYTYENSFQAWLYTIMRNTFINSKRKQKLGYAIFDSNNDDFYVNAHDSRSSIQPIDYVIADELDNVVEQLDDEMKIPFRMHNDGFKYKEISEELNIPIGTVKSRIFMARKKLMGQVKRN